MTIHAIEQIRAALKQYYGPSDTVIRDTCTYAIVREAIAHIDALEAEIRASDLVTAEYRQQCLDNAAEIERLRTESEERLQNAVALVSENERLRAEVTRPESTDMTLMRTLVQSQATGLARLRKDAERKPMTETEIVKCLVQAGCIGTVKMTFESGPYDITRPSIKADNLVREVEAFHGIKGTP